MYLLLCTLNGTTPAVPNSLSSSIRIKELHHVLCCFALFVCLTLLASFFLPSHLSFKNMYMYIHSYMMTESKIKETRYSITSRIQRNRIRCTCRYMYNVHVYGIYTIEKTIQVLHTLLYSSAHLHMCRGTCIWDLYDGNQVGR